MNRSIFRATAVFILVVFSGILASLFVATVLGDCAYGNDSPCLARRMWAMRLILATFVLLAGYLAYRIMRRK